MPVPDDGPPTMPDNLKAQDVALVLHHRQPEAAAAAGGARLLVIDSDSEDAIGGLKASVGQVVGALRQG